MAHHTKGGFLFLYYNTMKAGSEKNAKKETLYEGEFIRFVKKGPWEYVERNNCSGIVIILAMTKEQRVIFVEQYRVPVDKKVIEFPAGLVDDDQLESDESLVTAAKRELLEETGYEAQEMELLLEGPVSSGSTSDMVSIFKALNIQKVGEGGGDEYESIIIH